MQIDQLQHRLSALLVGEALTLAPGEFECAFLSYRERDVRRIAAIELGELYSCSVRFSSIERDEVVFTRTDKAGVFGAPSAKSAAQAKFKVP